MRLPFLRSKATAAAERTAPAGGGEPGPVLAARTRARRRLAGALVLLVAGVITFPLLFETQPRPLPVDTPIELPPRELAPTANPMPAAALTPVPAAPVPPPVAAEPAPAPAPQQQAQPTPALPTQATQATQAASMPASMPASGGQAGAAGRFVVQAGAYSEATALREARQKVEKLGLKTYIQVIDSEAGKRTRVRVGPFATRQEAEVVAAKVKAAGLPTNILTL